MKATIVVEGSAEELERLIRQINALEGVELALRSSAAPLDWEAHPALARLRPIEREIVRLDLSYATRSQIAKQLELTPGTVTVYRRSIRLKLRAVLPEQQPPALRDWLRRFPGQPGATPPRPRSRPSPEA